MTERRAFSEMCQVLQERQLGIKGKDATRFGMGGGRLLMGILFKHKMVGRMG